MKNLNLSKQDVINRIGYFRNKKNMSAYKLGMQLGHCKTYFYKIENGEIDLSLSTFMDILNILDVSTAQFFYPQLDQFDKDIEMLNLINGLSDEERASIVTLLKIKR